MSFDARKPSLAWALLNFSFPVAIILYGTVIVGVRPPCPAAHVNQKGRPAGRPFVFANLLLDAWSVNQCAVCFVKATPMP